MIAAISVGITIGINDSLRHLMRNIAEIRPTGLVLVPLFVSSFRRAYELATAMECRCYNGGEGKTRMKQMLLLLLQVV